MSTIALVVTLLQALREMSLVGASFRPEARRQVGAAGNEPDFHTPAFSVLI